MKKGSIELVLLAFLGITAVFSVAAFAAKENPVERPITAIACKFRPSDIVCKNPSPPPSSPQLMAYTNYSGQDQAGQAVVNGCITTGPQKGTGAVKFSWTGTKSPVFVSWTGDISGRFPENGTTTNPFVISGWTSGAKYNATINIPSITNVTRLVQINNCKSSGEVAKLMADTNYSGADQAGQKVVSGCITTGPQKGTGAIKFSWTNTGSSPVYVSWTGDISGRFPENGTTTNPFVISGWTPNANYTAKLNLQNPPVGLGTSVNTAISFKTNTCSEVMQQVQCLPLTTNGIAGQTFSFSASGGNGTYKWFAPEGLTKEGAGTGFATAFSGPGTKIVTVTSGISVSSCTVNLVQP